MVWNFSWYNGPLGDFMEGSDIIWFSFEHITLTANWRMEGRQQGNQ